MVATALRPAKKTAKKKIQQLQLPSLFEEDVLDSKLDLYLNETTTKSTIPLKLLERKQSIDLEIKNGLIKVNNIHKASGKPKSKIASQWINNSHARTLAMIVAATTQLSPHEIYDTKHGIYGGTWLHWRLAIAYAESLSDYWGSYLTAFVQENILGMKKSPEQKRNKTEFDLPDFVNTSQTRKEACTDFYCAIADCKASNFYEVYREISQLTTLKVKEEIDPELHDDEVELHNFNLQKLIAHKLRNGNYKGNTDVVHVAKNTALNYMMYYGCSNSELTTDKIDKILSFV